MFKYICFVLLLISATYSIQAPEFFQVKFVCTSGNATFNVTRAWAPLGVDRFYELITLKEGSYYNENGFFRVVEDFVVQFGINGNPSISSKWQNANIKDDPVVKSNLRGYMTYATAGPNTRTTQLFINYDDNSFLDSQGFTPFAVAATSNDMEAIDKVNAQYAQQPNQGSIYSEGNAYLKKNFPNLSYLTKTEIITK